MDAEDLPRLMPRADPARTLPENLDDEVRRLEKELRRHGVSRRALEVRRRLVAVREIARAIRVGAENGL